MNGEKDWHQSLTVWGGILATASSLSATLPFPAAVDAGIASLVAALGGLMAIIGRMRATTTITAPVPPATKGAA